MRRSASRTMRENLIAFVREITEVAEEEGVRLAIHPDDPAFPIFGLPRVISTADDVRKLFPPSPRPPAGSRSARARSAPTRQRPAGDGARIRAAHPFRASAQRQARGGRLVPRGRPSRRRTDMVALVAALLGEESRRRAEGRRRRGNPDAPRPRPSDRRRCQNRANPGYSFTGRLKGLAELRGVMQTVEAFRAGRVA